MSLVLPFVGPNFVSCLILPNLMPSFSPFVGVTLTISLTLPVTSLSLPSRFPLFPRPSSTLSHFFPRFFLSFHFFPPSYALFYVPIFIFHFPFIFHFHLPCPSPLSSIHLFLPSFIIYIYSPFRPYLSVFPFPYLFFLSPPHHPYLYNSLLPFTFHSPFLPLTWDGSSSMDR